MSITAVLLFLTLIVTYYAGYFDGQRGGPPKPPSPWLLL